MLKRLLASLATVIAVSVLPPSVGHAAPVRAGHLEAELVSASRGVTPGGEVRLALRQKIDKDWHTYWRNSGDSGAPTELAWTLPPGWSAGEIVWAPPSRTLVGPLMNYGYSGEVLLPVTVKAVTYLGPVTEYDLVSEAGDRLLVSASSSGEGAPKEGDKLSVDWRIGDAFVVD
ncbi:MAG: TOBE domain-containing protein [Betaproteobacteria bacterium]|nr:TOBE domain-containing protein [Betaproteobacteria bacterium]